MHDRDDLNLDLGKADEFDSPTGKGATGKVDGKTVVLGVIDLGDQTVESPELVARRIGDALKYIPAERLVPAPDCGMKYLTREVAFGKLQALTTGTALARRQLT